MQATQTSVQNTMSRMENMITGFQRAAGHVEAAFTRAVGRNMLDSQAEASGGMCPRPVQFIIFQTYSSARFSSLMLQAI